MKATTRENYSKRIEQVIAYLTQHLDHPLDLHRLAEEASLSPYHFHRIYVALMNESVAQTVRRLRLHRAAASLLLSETPLAKLARDAGYSNAQTFSRAFKEAYHLTPSAYRLRGGIKDALQFDYSGAVKEHDAYARDMYDVVIENRLPVHVAAQRHEGDYMMIGHSFERLAAWAAGQNLFNRSCRVFVIYYDDPALVPEAKLRADVCITVPEDFSISNNSGLRLTHTPGGRCAKLNHIGPFPELVNAYTWLFGHWLPRQNEEPDDQPHFEEHISDPRTVIASALQTQICLPLKAKTTN